MSSRERSESYGANEVAGSFEPSKDAIALGINGWRERFKDRSSDLLTARENGPRLLPSLDELEQLSDEERRATIAFLGRYCAMVSAHSCMISKVSDWAENAALEIQKYFDGSERSATAQRIVQKLIQLSGLNVAHNRNTNTMGSSHMFSRALHEKFLDTLARSGRTDEIDVFVNPFHIEKGTTMYEPKRNEKAELALVPVTIDDIILDGKDSAIDIGGKTHALDRLNWALANGHYVLRSGENAFGELRGSDVLPDLRSGETLEVIPRAIVAIDPYTVTFVSSNKAALKERYGAAYLPFIRDLLTLKVEYKGEVHEITLKDNLDLIRKADKKT